MADLAAQPAPTFDVTQDFCNCLTLQAAMPVAVGAVASPYRGVITYVRVQEGELPSGSRIRLMATGAESDAEEAGVMAPEPLPVDALGPGEQVERQAKGVGPAAQESADGEPGNRRHGVLVSRSDGP